MLRPGKSKLSTKSKQLTQTRNSAKQILTSKSANTTQFLISQKVRRRKWRPDSGNRNEGNVSIGRHSIKKRISCNSELLTNSESPLKIQG
jgi:hypothetical protein